MDDYALVLNAGSSSLKYAVFQRPPGEEWMVPARGQVDGLGSTPRFRASDRAGKVIAEETLDKSVKDGGSALEYLAQWLRNRFGTARLLGVGHRVVHGGARFAGPVIVTPQILEELKALIPLAPLHQPHNLAAIETVAARLPGVPQVACFDTSFHRGQSPVAEVVPLPLEVQGERGTAIRVPRSFVQIHRSDAADGGARHRAIARHRGAPRQRRQPVRDERRQERRQHLRVHRAGRPVYGHEAWHNRSGRGAVSRPAARALRTRNRGDALQAIGTCWGCLASATTCGYSSRTPILRLNWLSSTFVYQAVKQIGALTAVLGGLDGLVFTAGIGENSPEIRRRICEGCRWIGVELDNEANDHNRARISVPRSRVATWVIPTNEELMIARHTGELLGLIETRAVGVGRRVWLRRCRRSTVDQLGAMGLT